MVRGATSSSSTDWYDYLLDALEPEECYEPIFNAAPLADPGAAAGSAWLLLMEETAV